MKKLVLCTVAAVMIAGSSAIAAELPTLEKLIGLASRYHAVYILCPGLEHDMGAPIPYTNKQGQKVHFDKEVFEIYAQLALSVAFNIYGNDVAWKAYNVQAENDKQLLFAASHGPAGTAAILHFCLESANNFEPLAVPPEFHRIKPSPLGEAGKY
jgi:hypothetical protein